MFERTLSIYLMMPLSERFVISKLDLLL